MPLLLKVLSMNLKIVQLLDEILYVLAGIQPLWLLHNVQHYCMLLLCLRIVTAFARVHETTHVICKVCNRGICW